MNSLVSLLIILFSIILAILIISLYIVYSIKRNIGESAFNEIKNAIKNRDLLQKEELSRKKSVIGMTNLVLPRILEDYSDFNEQLLYNKIENDLNQIFNVLEKRIYVSCDELYLIQDILNNKVDDLISRNEHVKYSDIKFHRHAIKSYQKSSGIAKIETSSTLEYYYNSDLQKNKFDDIKRQTRYTCTYIFIYDYNKAVKSSNQKLFIFNCPNCGAPLDKFEDGNCGYCMSHIGQEKLKVWKISSYKEDYQ